MNRATYYSPLYLAPLLILALNESLRAHVAFLEPWLQWVVIGVVAVIFGVQCQILMIGAQGAFAQVLPVPRGRSIRGRGAAAAGWLLIVWFILVQAASMMRLNEMSTASFVPGLAALAALIAAAIIYIWNYPTAVSDFGDDRQP